MFLLEPLCRRDYILFFNSMNSGNLQCSIISRVRFSIIKISVSPSKNALYFCFSSFVMYFALYFANVLPKFSYILFFIVMLHCFNTTFSTCFICNFCNHFIHTQEKYNFFVGIEYSIIFHLSLWFYTTKFYNFIFSIFTS